MQILKLGEIFPYTVTTTDTTAASSVDKILYYNGFFFVLRRAGSVRCKHGVTFCCPCQSLSIILNDLHHKNVAQQSSVDIHHNLWHIIIRS